MKLFTIGDSLSQGFMSLAAARTDLSYSTLIAKALGVQSTQYSIQQSPAGGLPLNLELLFRRWQKQAGNRIDWFDYPSVALTTLDLFDDVEDYYERGDGAWNKKDSSNVEWWPNVSIAGFNIADAWQVSSNLCRDRIIAGGGLGDDSVGLPSANFYRNALRVLNPSRDFAKYGDRTALDWLKFHAEHEGIENVVLWLGSNNALGTVVRLGITATNDPRNHYSRRLDHVAQRRFNLWGPVDFENDFIELLDRVGAALQNNIYADWRVFVGTVPAVTIAPLVKGVGETTLMEDPFGVLTNGSIYYRYYTYFLFDYEFAHTSEFKIDMKTAYMIDSYIARYRQSIKRLVAAKNSAGINRYHVVDICEALLKLAYKRNNGQPTYQFPQYIKDHYPVVDTRYYHTNSDGALMEGGVFSLDGVHPSAIGQGLLAHEFLNVMNAVRNSNLAVDWPAVYQSDDLFMRPLRIMPSVRKQSRVAEFLLPQLLKGSDGSSSPNVDAIKQDLRPS